MRVVSESALVALVADDEVKVKLARAVLCLVLAEQYEWQRVTGGSVSAFAKVLGLDPTSRQTYARYDKDLRARIAKDAGGAIALHSHILELLARSGALSMDTRLVAFAALVSKANDVQRLVRAGMTTTFLHVMNAARQEDLPEAIRDVLDNPRTHWQPPPRSNVAHVGVDQVDTDASPPASAQPSASNPQPKGPKYSRLAEAMRIST